MDNALFQNLTPQLATFLTAMTPVGELRASIPLALTVHGMGALESYIWSVAGNMLPVIFLLAGLEKMSSVLMHKSPRARAFFNWLFERTRKKFTGHYETWGELALVVFVAVPLPMTGAWTGSIAAYLFGIPAKRAFLLILAGVMIAGAIVTLFTAGASGLFF